MFSVCCVAIGTLFVDLPDHIICGMSHPLRLTVCSRHARNGFEMFRFDDLAGPEKVRQASIILDPGESVLVILLYAK